VQPRAGGLGTRFFLAHPRHRACANLRLIGVCFVLIGYQTVVGQCPLRNIMCTSNKFKTQDTCKCCAGEQRNLVREYTIYSGGPDFWICQACPAGKVNYEPSEYECQPPPIIPPYTPACVAISEPWLGKDCECGPGTYRSWYAGSQSLGHSDRKWNCEMCTPGKFQPSHSMATSCLTCPRGKKSGYFRSECDDCAQGKTSDSGAELCYACTSGKYAKGTGNVVCEACARGKYTEYQIGTVVLASGASECFTNQQFCRNNNYCNNDAVVNRICTCCSGQFMTTLNGIRRCEKCPHGKYMDTDSHTEANCKTCKKGSYPTALPFTDTASAQIPVDFGLADHGSIECVAALGAMGCNRCPVGTYKGDTDNYLCEDCLPGHYMNSTGASACYPCVRGTYSDRIHSDRSKCLQCLPGSSSIEGASRCDLCPEGKAASVAGSLCTECGKGSYAGLS
jgi:hypothetical protein